jgi:hypothetical protein
MDFSEKDKCEFLGLANTRASRKRLRSFDSALMVLQSWGTYRAIKRRLHLRGKKLDRILKRLDNANILETREDGRYKSALRAFFVNCILTLKVKVLKLFRHRSTLFTHLLVISR